jgi:hypothetical protein
MRRRHNDSSFVVFKPALPGPKAGGGLIFSKTLTLQKTVL